MTFLPIVGRELRVASRRRGTYWGRLGASLIGILLFAWIYFVMISEAPREMAKVIFSVLSGLCLLFCLISGVRATADCLSQEKRDGTLGLLFLTDLKGFDVVLGKLTATSLSTFYSLLAVFPVLSVPILIGGVSYAEVGRMVLVLVNTMLFSLACGMFCSSFTHSARNAMGLTFLLILLVNGVPPLAGAITAAVYELNRVEIPYLIPSAGYAFALAFDVFHIAYKPQFWISCAITHGLTWAFLILASVVIPHTWQDRPDGKAKVRLKDRWKQWCYGDVGERVRFRTRLLDVNPMLWLCSRARFKPALVWGFLGLLGCGWVWAALKVGDEWYDLGTYLMTAFLLNATLKVWMGAESSQRFVEDRRNNALELLFSTALSVEEIADGQFRAMRRMFQWPLAAVLAIDFVLIVVPVLDRGWSEDSRLHTWMVLSGMVVLVADLLTMHWVGMWVGLTSRHPNRASGTTVAWVLTMPWVAFLILMMAAAFLHSGRSFEPGWQGVLGLWVALSLVNDAAAGIWCRQVLRTQMRELAVRNATFDRAPRKWWPFGRSAN
jgi:ABC-type transport system involved in multi-copper enzyme maturation permease subunit